MAVLLLVTALAAAAIAQQCAPPSAGSSFVYLSTQGLSRALQGPAENFPIRSSLASGAPKTCAVASRCDLANTTVMAMYISSNGTAFTVDANGLLAIEPSSGLPTRVPGTGGASMSGCDAWADDLCYFILGATMNVYNASVGGHRVFWIDVPLNDIAVIALPALPGSAAPTLCLYNVMSGNITLYNGFTGAFISTMQTPSASYPSSAYLVLNSGGTNRPALLASTTDALYSFDIATGALNWNFTYYFGSQSELFSMYYTNLVFVTDSAIIVQLQTSPTPSWDDDEYSTQYLAFATIDSGTGKVTWQSGNTTCYMMAVTSNCTALLMCGADLCAMPLSGPSRSLPMTLVYPLGPNQNFLQLLFVDNSTHVGLSVQSQGTTSLLVLDLMTLETMWTVSFNAAAQIIAGASEDTVTAYVQCPTSQSVYFFSSQSGTMGTTDHAVPCPAVLPC